MIIILSFILRLEQWRICVNKLTVCLYYHYLPCEFLCKVNGIDGAAGCNRTGSIRALVTFCVDLIRCQWQVCRSHVGRSAAKGKDDLSLPQSKHLYMQEIPVFTLNTGRGGNSHCLQR